jgi:ubiquinone/menaquinone biosynthesis C-methylase UbiE
MDLWKFFDITHRHHRLCNPTSIEKLDELCGLFGLPPGARVLDIACGKAELLVRLAERFGIAGVGVDLSPYALKEAASKHIQRVPGAALEFLSSTGRSTVPRRPHRLTWPCASARPGSGKGIAARCALSKG